MTKTHFLLAYLFIFTCSDGSYGQEQQAVAMAPVMPPLDAMWGHRAPASYQVLPRPASHFTKGQPHAYVGPTNPVEYKPVQPYAYGWFGTQFSPQWHRQFGYQKAYTQWTLK